MSGPSTIVKVEVNERAYLDGQEPCTVKFVGTIWSVSHPYAANKKVEHKRDGSSAYAKAQHKKDAVWIGIAFDRPIGHHGGKVNGIRYFNCKPKHGVFVRPHRLTPMKSDSSGPSSIPKGAPPRLGIKKKRAPLPRVATVQSKAAPVSESPGRKTFSPRKWLSKPPRVAGLASTPSRGGVKSRLNQAPVQNVSLYLSQTNTSPPKKRGGVPRCAQVPKGKKKEKQPSKFIHEVQPRGAGTSRLDVDSDDEEEQIPKKKGKGKGRKSPRKISPAVSRSESPSHEFQKDATEDDDDEVPSPTREAWSNDAPPTLSETDEDDDENIDGLNQSGFGSGYVSLVEEEDEENLIENDAKLLDQMLDTLEEAIEAADSGDTRLTPVSFEEADIASPSAVPSKIEDLAKRREAERRAREEKIQEEALRRRSSMQSTEPPKTTTEYDTALAAQTAIIEEQSMEIAKVLTDLENDTEDLNRETLKPDPVVVSNAVSALSVAIIQGAEVVSDVTMVRNEMALVHANDVGNIIPKIIAAKAAASSAKIDVENAIAALEKVDVNGDSASIIATAKATVKRFETAESAAALTLNEAEQTLRSETDISELEVTTNEAKTISNAVFDEVPVNSADGEGKFNTKVEAQAIKAEEEAKLKAEEEAKIKAEEEESKAKAEEEARIKAEDEEAKAKAEEEARIKAEEEEAKAKAEEEARIKAEEEAKVKAEEEAKAAKIQAEKDSAAFLAAEFPIDTPVKLHSLNNNKKLNGSMGVVVKHIPAKNRAGVKLDNGNTLSLKVANLRKLTEEDISQTDETIVASEREKSNDLETVGLAAAAATTATVALPDVLSPEVGVTSPVAPVTKETVAAEEVSAASEGTAEVTSSVEVQATIETVPEPVESGTAEAIVTQAIEVPVDLAAPLSEEDIVKAVSTETEVAVESISDPVEAAHEDVIPAQAFKLNAEEVAPDTPEEIVEAVSSAVVANVLELVEVADEVSAMDAVEVATEDIEPESSEEVVQIPTVTDSEAHPENITESVAPEQVELTSDDSATENYVESAAELVEPMSGDDPDDIAEDVVEEMPSVGRAIEEATAVEAQIEDTVVESADAPTKAEILVENISESVEAADETSTAVKASTTPAEAAAPEFVAENDVVPSEIETVVVNAPKPVESESVTSETIADSATELVVPVSESEAADSTEISTDETATEPSEDITNTVLSGVEAVSESVAETVRPTTIEVVEEEMNTSDKLFDDAVDATEADVVGVAIEEAAEEMLVLAVAEERIADNIIDEIQDEELKEIVVSDTDAEEKRGVIVEPEPDSMHAEETMIPVFTENMNTEELAVMMESLGESEAAAIIVDQNLDASDLLQMDVNELQEELNISLDDTQKIVEHVDLSVKDPEDEVLTKNFNPAGPYQLEWDCETLCTWLDQSGIALEIIDMIHTNNLDAEDLVELEEDEIRSWVSVGRRGSIDGALDNVQKLMLLVHGIAPSSVNILPALSEEEEDISAEDIADATPDFDLDWDSATLTSWMTIMGLDNFVETIAEHDLDAMDLYHLELEEMVEAFNVPPDDEEALENVQDLYDLVHEEIAEEEDLDMSIEPPPKMQSKWRENIVTSWNNDQLCMWLKEMGATDVSRVINEQVSGVQIVQLGRDELQHILVDLDESKLDNIHNALRKQARPAFRPDFSADDIVEWLSQIGESRWKTTVQTNEYDGQDLLEMSISELSSIFGESAEDLKAAMIWKAAPTAV